MKHVIILFFFLFGVCFLFNSTENDNFQHRDSFFCCYAYRFGIPRIKIPSLNVRFRPRWNIKNRWKELYLKEPRWKKLFEEFEERWDIYELRRDSNESVKHFKKNEDNLADKPYIAPNDVIIQQYPKMYVLKGIGRFPAESLKALNDVVKQHYLRFKNQERRKIHKNIINYLQYVKKKFESKHKTSEIIKIILWIMGLLLLFKYRKFIISFIRGVQKLQ